MRISDWSSDVCSSDLIGEVPRDDLHLKTQIRITLDISVVTWWKPQHHAALFFWTVPQHRHVVRGPRLELVALGRGGLRVERGLFLLDLPAVPAPRCLRILAPEREGRRHAGNRAAQVRLPRHVEPRSEEHTSELQSLKRNPYAAFCLI